MRVLLPALAVATMIIVVGEAVSGTCAGCARTVFSMLCIGAAAWIFLVATAQCAWDAARWGIL